MDQPERDDLDGWVAHVRRLVALRLREAKQHRPPRGEPETLGEVTDLLAEELECIVWVLWASMLDPLPGPVVAAVTTAVMDDVTARYRERRAQVPQ